MLFQLSEGDATKTNHYKTWTYAQAVEWCMMARYKNYVERMQIEKHGR